jgi:hypothetical protein
MKFSFFNSIVLLCAVGVCLLSLSDRGSEAKSLMQKKNAALTAEKSDRPLTFKTKQDLLKYIKKVNEHYAIAGRPRFGKRSSNDWFSAEDTDDSDISNEEEAFVDRLSSMLHDSNHNRYEDNDEQGHFDVKYD